VASRSQIELTRGGCQATPGFELEHQGAKAAYRCIGDAPYARTMSLPNAYLTSFKNVPAILKAINTAQSPPRFT
jgi:hypothetical protein